MQNQRAFTLIELLIVVAIIAILAAIAVPNFLEAQTRSKVSRMKADIRTLTTGIEAYAVDWNVYPPHLRNDGTEIPYPDRYVVLTTPVAFLTSITARDIFFTEVPTGPGAPDQYVSWTNFRSFETRGTHPLLAAVDTHRWLLRSRGPDGIVEDNAVRNGFMLDGITGGPSMVYDPSNGTISRGDVFRTAQYVQ